MTPMIGSFTASKIRAKTKMPPIHHMVASERLSTSVRYTIRNMLVMV